MCSFLWLEYVTLWDVDDFLERLYVFVFVYVKHSLREAKTGALKHVAR